MREVKSEEINTLQVKVSKLMHSYAHRLQDLPPNTKVHTILSHNQCWYYCAAM